LGDGALAKGHRDVAQGLGCFAELGDDAAAEGEGLLVEREYGLGAVLGGLDVADFVQRDGEVAEGLGCFAELGDDAACEVQGFLNERERGVGASLGGVEAAEPF